MRKVRACRRYPAEAGGEALPLRVSPDQRGGLSVGVGAVKTCATWHSCMGGCSAKIAAHRAEELDHALRVWDALGGQVVLWTISLRHHSGQRLRDLIEAQRAGRKAVVSDRPWRDDRDALGVRWVLWAWEATHGDEHGWHPHYHVFLLCDRREWETTRVPWGTSGKTRERLVKPIGEPEPMTEGYAETVLRTTWGRWRDGLATKGATAIAYVVRQGAMESAGMDVTIMSTSAREAFGRYPFKLAMEAVGALWKHGREDDGKRHRTPFEVMTDHAVARREGHDTVAAADRTIVAEWSETLTDLRVRQCAWPPGMRSWFAEKAAELDIPGPLLEEELSDEEIAEQDDHPDSETVGYVRPGEWSQVIAYELDTLRRAGRTGGMPGIVAWFEGRGLVLETTEYGELLRHTTPDPPPRRGVTGDAQLSSVGP